MHPAPYLACPLHGLQVSCADFPTPCPWRTLFSRADVLSVNECATVGIADVKVM